MKNIKIGTLIEADINKARQLFPKLKEWGFESIGLNFDLRYDRESMAVAAKEFKELCTSLDIEISILGIYKNALEDNDDGRKTIETWNLLIEFANEFGTDLVTGFTGRIPDSSVEDSLPKFKEVFTDILDNAKANNVRIAFENCSMGGDWWRGSYNLAYNPLIWEKIFEMFPDKNIGLQWEPCHQMVQLIDPIAQLKKWAKSGKIYHLHGKDCTIDWDVIKEYGIYTNIPFAYHRTPGFGDCNWADIISILRMNNYNGNIDIEGYHDPVYRGEWEMTGQIHGLNYLKNCRGNDFVKNPEGLF